MKKIFVMGSLNMDVCINTQKFPREGETVIGDGFMTSEGGKGANQAVAAAKQGAKVIMLGACGNDLYGEKLVNSLKDNNVITDFMTTKNGTSGVAVIIINKGKNRIIIDSGANYNYSYEDYKDILVNQAKEGDIFITQMETRLDNVIKGIKLANSQKMKVILNPAPAQKLPLDIYDKIDIIIPNETEAEYLTGIAPDSDENINKIIDRFIQWGVKSVIITLGNKGSVFYDNKETHIVPITDSVVVDTTGAGDSFIGAFAVELSKGKSFYDAIRYATVCSAITVSRYGAQKAIPTRKEIENYNK